MPNGIYDFVTDKFEIICAQRFFTDKTLLLIVCGDGDVETFLHVLFILLPNTFPHVL